MKREDKDTYTDFTHYMRGFSATVSPVVGLIGGQEQEGSSVLIALDLFPAFIIVWCQPSADKALRLKILGRKGARGLYCSCSNSFSKYVKDDF